MYADKNAKFPAMLMILVVLIEVFSFSIGFSLVASTISISNTGRILVGYAKSGSAADIQAAVNSVASTGGGTVVVPAGNWTWNGETVNITAGVDVIGTGVAGCSDHTSNWTNYAAQTILHNTFPQGSPSMPTMFRVGPHDPGPGLPHTASRISGIQFEATPPVNETEEDAQNGQAIEINQISNYRVDHCTFIDFCNVGVSATCNSGWNLSATCYGVIDHCVFTLPYKTTSTNDGSKWIWGYGAYASGMYIDVSQWDSNVSDFYGYYGPRPSISLMYVEDCHFSYYRHCTDSLSGGFNVVRFCLCDHPACAYTAGSIDLHGSGGWISGRGMEVYNNTIYGAPGNLHPWPGGTSYYSEGICLRGGMGLFYNNNFICDTYSSYDHFIGLANDDAINATITEVNNTYIWTNNYVNCTFLSVAAGYLQNVNYFLRAPNQAQDGFTYNPYLYPHPLTLGGA